MNALLVLMTVTKMQIALIVMEGLIAYVKETILEMEDHVSVIIFFCIIFSWQLGMAHYTLCLYIYIIDKNECNETCSQRCIVTSSSSFCGCQRGHYLSSDLRTCEGIHSSSKLIGLAVAWYIGQYYYYYYYYTII